MDNYITYIAINQIHLELLDELTQSQHFKHPLKNHLIKADKIMSNNAAKFDEKDEIAYNTICKLGDALLGAANKVGWEKTLVYLQAIADGQVKEE